ncbi:Trp biosynthesis-associated membrane protein [Microbacterium candidum]|uniref:Trp biosynthesis-associated membrane protein n=1 Tax=Microbacterium candidum TaxID=3041922 RepID=A0ABT7MZB3_9MICO|nr:Trp biosynthesis-associated membrane protein [Microbacterium sp. ASV49]MDL9979798.1 Trp biosynthesis-associated membrane protein [Microbacterium sp. ASV49]
MRRRAKLTSIVLMLIAGATGVISSTQTWLEVTISGVSAHSLPVPGASAVQVLAPLCLAVLALGLALSIVGRVLRYVFGALALVIALVLGWLTAQIVFTMPVAAVQTVVTKATGIAGLHAIAGLVGRISQTAWPAITLLACVVLAFAGVLTLATGARWNAGGRRFRADEHAKTPAAGPLDALDSWDGLSRGEDPTAGEQPR